MTDSRQPDKGASTPGWAAVRLEELPLAAEPEPGAAWYPLQHVFGLTAFGANAWWEEHFKGVKRLL